MIKLDAVKQVEVGRKGNFVIISMKCADEYAAMMLYDQFVAELKSGFARIDFVSVPGTARERP